MRLLPLHLGERAAVEGRDDEAQRLHRIPQFLQGAGGASESRLARKSR
jgi:hypothetical protein